jgi:hypothetical protein
MLAIILSSICTIVAEQKKNATPRPSITIEPFRMPLPMMNKSIKDVKNPFMPKAPSS